MSQTFRTAHLNKGRRRKMKEKTNQFNRIFKTSGLFITKLGKKLMAAICAAYIAITTSMPAFAAPSVSDSKLAKGTEKLIQDVTTWLMVLAPVVAGLLIIYFCIRRSAADEMDQKKWNNRIVVAIVSCIGAVLGSATLNLLIGYYQ
jgi:ABC-type molybdate transport system permease subunit